jgi:hypothetical protein
MSSAVRWLAAVEGHRKHSSWRHPVAAFAVGLCTILVASVRAHDMLFGVPSVGMAESSLRQHHGSIRRRTAMVLLSYVVGMFAVRLPMLGLAQSCYEMLWSCNTAMVLASFGLFTERKRLVAAAALSVAIDQLMWYVDLVGFVAAGKWPVGVAKYLARPETTWARIMTSAHHLFFLPLCLCTVGFPAYSPSAGENWEGIPRYICHMRDDYVLMLCIITVTAMISRFVTPFHLAACHRAPARSEKGKSRSGGDAKKMGRADPVADAGGTAVVLNINLVYEVWKDVGRNFPFLECSHPYGFIHVPRLLLIWGGLTAPCALVLASLSRLLSFCERLRPFSI